MPWLNLTDITPKQQNVFTQNNFFLFCFSQKKVVIDVENVDDNAPEFEKVGKVSILEDIGIGQQVVRFKANDKDDSKITYKITGGNGDDKFKIDTTTGTYGWPFSFSDLVIYAEGSFPNFEMRKWALYLITTLYLDCILYLKHLSIYLLYLKHSSTSNISLFRT